MRHVRVCVDSRICVRVSAHVFTHARARVRVRAVVCTCVQMGHTSSVGERGRLQWCGHVAQGTRFGTVTAHVCRLNSPPSVQLCRTVACPVVLAWCCAAQWAGNFHGAVRCAEAAGQSHIRVSTHIPAGVCLSWSLAVPVVLYRLAGRNLCDVWPSGVLLCAAGSQGCDSELMWSSYLCVAVPRPTCDSGTGR